MVKQGQGGTLPRSGSRVRSPSPAPTFPLYSKGLYFCRVEHVRNHGQKYGQDQSKTLCLLDNFLPIVWAKRALREEAALRGHSPLGFLMEGFRWLYCVLFLMGKRVWRRFSQHINRPAQIVWSEMRVQLRRLLHRMP